MTDAFLDQLPGHERRRLRRMMSAEAYEKLREKVKGPEDLERELKRAERLAELRFEMEAKPEFREQLRGAVDADVRENGWESVFESDALDAESRQAIEQGKYVLTVSSHPSTHEDALVAVPEGTVQEKIPLKRSMSEKYTSQFLHFSPPAGGETDRRPPQGNEGADAK